MNRHLVLSGGRPAKLEYTSLAFEVGHEHLDGPLYVFFRALNYTDNDEAHRATEGCLALFIEAEFNPIGTECLHNPAMTSSSSVEVLKDMSHLAAGGSAQLLKGTDHSIKDPSSTFLAYKDYYIEEPTQGTPDERLADMEITVSLMQKFIESNTLDLVVEVLAEDVDLATAQKGITTPSHQPASGLIHRALEDGRVELVRGGKGPTCATNCFVGGEKSFNEMLRVISLSPRTSFRVWVFQQSPDHQDDQWCANFQLSVTAKPLEGGTPDQMKKQAEMLKCPVPELPETLNSPHFL